MSNIRRQKIRLYREQKGLCHWCHKHMDSPTLDHLDDKWSPERGKHGNTNEVRHVLACQKCNNNRSARNQKAAGRIELQARANRSVGRQKLMYWGA